MAKSKTALITGRFVFVATDQLGLLLAALVVAAFGCAAVLMAGLRVEERDPELFSDI